MSSKLLEGRTSMLGALALCSGASFLSARTAQAGCELARMLEVPVTMTGLRPLVQAKINDADVQLIADSGSFFSLLSPAAAAQYKIPLSSLPIYYSVLGVNGYAGVSLGSVEHFSIGGITLSRIPFLVGGTDFGVGAVGLLGQNFFRAGDVDYDLANGIIRLMRAKDCASVNLAYWAKGTPYSVIDINAISAENPHTAGIAYLNGRKIRVVFDTGAGASYLSLDAARRAGVKPGDTGVVDGGLAGGIGQRMVRTWIATFPSLKIGDEEIRNAKLRIGENVLTESDLLLGADFFLSHHIYVATSQRKLYFTYNGGPVFNLESAPTPAVASEQAADAPGPSADAGPEPADAAGYSRRGAAEAARHDYERAIADLNRACELAPRDPQYFYQRALANWNNHHPELAAPDLDQAIQLKPDDVDARIARVELKLQSGDPKSVIDDLDAAERAAPKEAESQLELGSLYGMVGQYAEGLHALDSWIDSHGPDEQLGDALNSRCWLRAMWGRELDRALTDCNAALRRGHDDAQYLDSRGLVYLRLGQYDRSIADYDAALKQAPKQAWSLYGRGIAKLRKGSREDGEADIAAATALDPKLLERATAAGIVR